MPETIMIGPIPIHLYGVLIILGALGATMMSVWRARQFGEDPERPWDILPWALIGGVVGARIWHILTPPASMVAEGYTALYYLQHPLDMLMIWKGGLGIPGAVIGGFIAVYLYCRKYDLSILKWADIIAPGLALAQAVGRLGNWVNQELYGAPTNLPWKLYIDPLHRLSGFQDVEYYHPLFAYEALYNLANMAILIWVGRRFKGWLKRGDVFFLYLVIYPVGRFLLEFLRLDPSPVAGLNVNQTLMGVIALVALVVLFLRHRGGVEPARPDSPVQSPK